MLVKSFGCSFIFGTDLPDQLSFNPSRLTWPAIFSRQKNHHYRCHAQAGSGNLAITERVLEEVARDVTALFIISWTWIDRFDYIDKTQNWSTIRPGSDSALAKTYYQELHSETQDKLLSLIAMRSVIDSLQEKGFPFIMTYMDELLFDCKYNTTPAITALQDYVKPYMTTFEGQTFLNWSRNKGYPESPGWHPLTEAHSAAADVIIQSFDKQNTNDHLHHV
jgi:hypothetical protein